MQDPCMAPDLDRRRALKQPTKDELARFQDLGSLLLGARHLIPERALEPTTHINAELPAQGDTGPATSYL